MPSETLAFDITARDRASSAFRKVASEADRTAAALKRSQKISDDVAKAETRLSKARDGEADSMGRVRVAEQHLQELRDKGQQGTLRFSKAEEALATARRKSVQSSNTAKIAEDSLGKARATLEADAKTAGKDAGTALGKAFGDGIDKEGPKAGKKFGSSLKRWLTGSGGLGEAGKAGGTVFGSGFLGVLKTPILGPAVVGIIGAAVAVAMPAVGAVAASGLVTAFGAGLSVLGFVFAAKSKTVQDSWKTVLASMGRDMTALSKPFEATLTHLSGTAAKTFADLRPQLASAFKVLAPAMSEFGDDLGKALGRLGPALVPLSKATASVLKSLGPGLQDALGKTSDGLIKLSDSVRKNPDGLADLARGVGDITNRLLGFITTLNDTNAQIKKLTGQSGVDLAVLALNFTAIGTLDTAFKGLDATLHGINAVTKPVGQGFHQTATSAQEAATATGYWLQGMTPAQAKMATLGAAAGKSAHEIHAANVAAYLLATAFDRQSAATQHSIDLLNRYSSRLLALSGAQIGYQQAVDDTTASIKENGHTHDLNTQKGRDNQTQLNSLTQSVIAQRDAMLNANDGNIKAAKFAETGRAAYAKFAVQMGYSKTQAAAMAAELIKIPPVSKVKLQANITDLQSKLATAQKELKSPNLTATKKAQLKAEISNLKAGIATSKGLLASLPMTRTARLQANIADLESKLKTAKSHLGDKNLTKERRATLSATIAKLEAGIRRAKGLLNSVPGSRNVAITTTFTEIHRVVNQGSRSSGGGVGGGHEIQGRAVGGPVKAGVPYIIGERGPELMVPSTNGTVIPKVPSATPVRTSAGTANTVVLRIESGGSRMDDLLVEILRKYVRVAGGGDVQQALGVNR